MPLSCHGSLDERQPAWPKSVARLRHAVLDFAAGCGATECQRDDIAIAVSEALSNTVIHAYVGFDEAGVVAVQAWKDDRSLVVVVCDEGIGMRPRVDSPGLGLGLPLIAQLTEHVEFEDTLEGARLRMTFALG